MLPAASPTKHCGYRCLVPEANALQKDVHREGFLHVQSPRT